MNKDKLSEFIELEFLIEKNIIKNSNILKSVFGIDLCNIETFNKKSINLKYEEFCKEKGYYKDCYNDEKRRIIKYENQNKHETEYIQWKKEKVDTFFKNLAQKNIEIMLKEISNLTIEIMDEYYIEIKEYFLIKDIDERLCNDILKSYLFENIKNSLILFKCMNSKQDFVNQDVAIKNYINFSSNKPVKINNQKVSNMSKNFSRIKKDAFNEVSVWKKSINEICVKNKTKIHPCFGNSYMYFIYNHKKNKYMNINFKGSYKEIIKNIKEYEENFFKNNVTYMDLYCFERISNISNLFFIASNSSKYDINCEEINKLFIEILSLPNVFFIDKFIYIINSLYDNTEKDNYDDFIKKLHKLCCHINYYLIPLYNMIFSNILARYCEKNSCKINDIVDKLSEITSVDTIKDRLEEMSKIDDNEINREILFKLYTITNNCWDIDIVKRKDIIKHITFDEEISKYILRCNQNGSYAKILKKLLIKLAES